MPNDNLIELLIILISIRKNILFNHYSAIQYDSPTNNSIFKRFFPLTNEQKRYICGLAIESRMKKLRERKHFYRTELNKLKMIKA